MGVFNSTNLVGCVNANLLGHVSVNFVSQVFTILPIYKNVGINKSLNIMDQTQTQSGYLIHKSFTNFLSCNLLCLCMFNISKFNSMFQRPNQSFFFNVCVCVCVCIFVLNEESNTLIFAILLTWDLCMNPPLNLVFENSFNTSTMWTFFFHFYLNN